MIGSLVRLRDNHLHMSESERVLRNEEKFKELVQLFQTKGQHKKGTPLTQWCPLTPALHLFSALDLLTQFHKGPTSELSGVLPTIEYLQNIGKDDMELVLQYSKWVLRENPNEGLRVSPSCVSIPNCFVVIDIH